MLFCLLVQYLLLINNIVLLLYYYYYFIFKNASITNHANLKHVTIKAHGIPIYNHYPVGFYNAYIPYTCHFEGPC